MKERAEAVIGANFGDCGKGLVTDYYASSFGSDCVNVRFNGGAQAGHTVVTPEGVRHVFGHFGTGTFAGAATLLSRFFISNPLLFLKERAALLSFGIATERLTPMIDSRSPLTTPYDMLINQMIEEARGAERHGTCGVGIGETIERNLNPRFATTVGDLRDMCAFRDKLDSIRREYITVRQSRAEQEWSSQKMLLVTSDTLLENFAADCVAFRDAIEIVNDADCLRSARTVVFEGAQGLLLDEDHEWFPHVTRSKTGIANVLVLASESGIDSLRATYVTRSFMTRHGAGPLPHELPSLPYAGIRDDTNIPNEHQGSLRFAFLDIDLVAQSIGRDVVVAINGGIDFDHRLAVTCLDQIAPNERAKFYRHGRLAASSPSGMVAELMHATGTTGALETYGPSRHFVADKSNTQRYGQYAQYGLACPYDRMPQP